MSPLQSAELASAQQALISGRVQNALTGAGIRPQLLQLSLRATPDAPLAALPAKIQFSGNGYFSLVGVASALFPQQLPAASSAELNYQVSAEGYSPLQGSVLLSQNSITAVAANEQLAGYELSVSRISAPAVHLQLSLVPLPVGLTGVVIEDNDLAAPLSGVSLQIIAPEVLPAVLSDELGRFRINALPLAAAVTLEISWGDAVSTINHVVDYTTLFNPRIISLTG